MTLTTTASRWYYDGNDATTAFPYYGRITEAAQLEVILTNKTTLVESDPLVLDSDYTVDGVGESSGNVNYPISGSPLATGYQITIRRKPTLTQTTDLSNQGGFFQETHEAVFDYLMMCIQYVQEQLDRCLKLPVSTIEEATSDAMMATLNTAVLAAETSETNAATSETNAATSETNAAASATAAAASAASIPGKASDAEAQAAAADDKYMTPAKVLQTIMAKVYPIGSYYFNDSDSTNPGTLLGFGTWVAVEEHVLVGYKSGSAEFGTPGGTYGDKTVTLTAAQSGLPAHTHNQRGASRSPAGGGSAEMYSAADDSGETGVPTSANASAPASQAHNNIQPSRTVYMWRRTA